MNALLRTGRCWKIGHDVASDALINARHAFEYDPRVLRRHLLHEIRPELAAEAQAGDLLLAGRRFAHGSQHSHPFLAMKEIGLGLLALPLRRSPFRLAIFLGVPVLEIGEDVLDAIDDGDRLTVDFGQGRIDHLESGRHWQVAPLPDFLLDVVRAGGGLNSLKQAAPAAISD
jgi:3-isopropylmalate/(R)-2-methylmalate dehydratase small subunit